MVMKLLENFMKKNCKRQIEQAINKKKVTNRMSTGKVMLITLMAGLIKKDIII